FGHGVAAVENLYNGHRQNGQWELQFGHGVAAVENRINWTIAQGSPLASIRPRRCRRGKPPLRPATCPIDSCFNSATALPPWKTLKCVNSTATEGLLQFGHGVAAVENWRGVVMSSA